MQADEELVQLLGALLSEQSPVRTAAEEALTNGRTQNGFPVRLARFAAGGPDGPEAVPVRQIALTTLKQLIADCWVNLAESDRAGVRQELLAGVCAAEAVRILVHVCIALATTKESQWPELYTQLGAGVRSGQHLAAQCCVECITVLLDECPAAVAVMLGPLQEPLLQLAAAESTPPAVRRKCVSAHSAGVNALIMCEVPEAALAAVVAQLPAWLTVSAALCEGSDSWSPEERVACAFLAIRATTRLSRHKPLEATMAGCLEGVLRPACKVLEQLEPVYTQAVVRSDDGGASEEEHGAAQLVAQFMELLQAMLMRSKLRTLLKGQTRRILQLLVPFMQITEAQVRTWREDANEFLAHEDDEHVRGCIVRLSGESLVGELITHNKRETAQAIASIVGELLEHGKTGDWKLTELGLFLFALVAADGPSRSLQKGDLGALAPTVFSSAAQLVANPGPEFLRARAFAVLRRLGDAVCAMSKGDVPGLLQASACALKPDQPLVVRVSACRAFCRFLTAVEDTSFRDQLLLEHGVLASLCALLNDSEEDVLHLSIESLTLLTRLCPQTMGKVDDSFGQLLVGLWSRSASDPLIQLSCLDLISCAGGSDPQLRHVIEERLLPAVEVGLQVSTEAHVTASSIDLYGVILKKADVPLGGKILSCAQPLVATVLRSDESGLLQNACDALTCLVKRSPAQVVEVGLLAPVLQAVERLLMPDLSDDACLFVGPLVTLLLQHFASQLQADLAKGLLRGVVQRLVIAERPFLKQSLVVVVARLLHQDLVNVLSALCEMQIQSPSVRDPASAPVGTSGLEVLLSIWLATSSDIKSKHSRNIAFSALCSVHRRCLEDEALRSAQTGGPPLLERLAQTLIEALVDENSMAKRRRERIAKAGVDSDDDLDDDEGDDDDDDGDGKPDKSLGKLLSDFDLEDDPDDDDDDDDDADTFRQLELADPLYALDLQKILADHLCAPGVVPSPSQLAEKAKAAATEAYSINASA